MFFGRISISKICLFKNGMFFLFLILKNARENVNLSYEIELEVDILQIVLLFECMKKKDILTGFN